MNVPEILRTAAYSLGANRLRAGLALLGIVIGVSSVVTLMSIGRGVQAEITSSIESLGTDLLMIRSGGEPRGGPGGFLPAPQPLTLADAEALADPELTPSVRAAAAELRTSGSVVAGRNNTFAEIFGVTSDYLSVRELSMRSGIFIGPTHVANRDEVVVLGSTIAGTLFGLRDPRRAVCPDQRPPVHGNRRAGEQGGVLFL